MKSFPTVGVHRTNDDSPLIELTWSFAGKSFGVIKFLTVTGRKHIDLATSRVKPRLTVIYIGLFKASTHRTAHEAGVSTRLHDITTRMLRPLRLRVMPLIMRIVLSSVFALRLSVMARRVTSRALGRCSLQQPKLCEDRSGVLDETIMHMRLMNTVCDRRKTCISHSGFGGADAPLATVLVPRS